MLKQINDRVDEVDTVSSTMVTSADEGASQPNPEVSPMNNIINNNTADHARMALPSSTPRHQCKNVSLFSNTLSPTVSFNNNDRSEDDLPILPPTLHTLTKAMCPKPKPANLRAQAERDALKQRALAQQAAAVAALTSADSSSSELQQLSHPPDLETAALAADTASLLPPPPAAVLPPSSSEPQQPSYLLDLEARAAAEATPATLAAVVAPLPPPLPATVLPPKAPKPKKTSNKERSPVPNEMGTRVLRLTVLGEQREKEQEAQRVKAAKVAERKVAQEEADNEERAKSSRKMAGKKTKGVK